MVQILERNRRFVVVAFFAVLAAIGVGVFRDYGVSWDERIQRKYGEEVYNYVVNGDRDLFTDRHRYYGPAFEALLIGLEKALRLEDTRTVYFMRHLATFLALWAATLFFYLLCKRVFRSWKVGLLGSILLVLSPRIFAHGFYNSKDIPFLAVFVLGAYTLLRYLEDPGFHRAALHGAVCALLIVIRIVGVFVPLLTAAFVGYAALATRPSGTALRQKAIRFGVYVAVMVAGVVALWPTLWTDPAANFVRVFEGMRNFPWEATVLYLGKYAWSTALPWHYTLVWIGVSTPISYLVLFILGLVVAVGVILAGGRAGAAPPVIGRRDSVLLLLWFFLPLGYSIATKAVLYDEWRHSFFVYPALLMLALAGLIGAHRQVRAWLGARPRAVATFVLAGLVVLNAAMTAGFMIRNHPHQNIYFNALVGGPAGAHGRFEMDYWGLSFRKGLEYIAQTDPAERILVHASTAPGRYNADVLAQRDRDRLVFVEDISDAKYYVTNYRWERFKRPPGSEAFSVKVDGATIMSVSRLPLSR